jgi:hypothetical protein
MSGKSKGGNFEREISVKLSLWFTEGKRDDVFYRSQSSGARATQRNKSKKTTEGQYGDIAATCKDGEPLIKLWSIECKTGYQSKSKLKDGTKKVTNWDILDLLDSKSQEPMFAQMWNQCVIDAEISERQPILIFRRERKLPLIAITGLYYSRLTNWFSISDFMIIHFDLSNLYYPYNKVTIIKLDDFLKWANPLTLVELVKE